MKSFVPVLLAAVLVIACQASGPATPTAGRSPEATASSSPVPTVTPNAISSPTSAPSADVAYVKDGEIWLSTAQGTSTRRLASKGPFSALAWSPDGKLLAAVKGTGIHTELHVFDVASGTDRIFQLSAYEAERPVWSPDSSMLAFPILEDRNSNGEVDSQDFGKVALLRVDDGATLTLDGRWVSWSPKGRELIVATTGTYTNGIYRDNAVVSIDVATEARKTLMKVSDVPQDLQQEYQYPFGPSTILLAYPSISPDGTKLAFTALGHTGLVGIKDLVSSKLRLFGFFYEGGAGVSAWSPDSRYLAYEGFPATGQSALGIVEISTQKEKVLGGKPNGGSEDRAFRQPAWSPDGRTLAVVMEDRRGQASIVLLDTSGKEIGQIATGNVAWPTWNPSER